MMDLAPWLCWIFPFLGAILVYPADKVSKKLRDFIAVIFPFLSVISAASLISNLLRGEYYDQKVAWLDLGSYGKLEFGVLVDPLSIIIANIVAVLCFLIILYSVGYMKHEPGIVRYWFSMNLFVGGMLLLVLADNLISLFIGWEIVGLCSYALIGHYYLDEKKYWIGGPEPYPFQKPSYCGLKALLTTRFGDVALLASIILLFLFSGTFNFMELYHKAPEWMADMSKIPGMLLLTLLLFIAGPLSKSAQFPFHEWLPEAMAGPTPVSALIHAATMVKAGVYLIARTFPIFYYGYWIAGFKEIGIYFLFVAFLGAFSAFLAGTQGMVALELKKALAYSTISQIGYMFLAIGVAGLSAEVAVVGYTAGIAHLMSHAFFKAALFLCAGAVIHATGTIYMHEMSLSRKIMPYTWLFMWIAALSLSGIPPLYGFWSKDAILLACLEGGRPLLFIIALITVPITAFYSFRFMGMVFHGNHEHREKHEAEKIMLIPYGLMAFVIVALGLVGPWLNATLEKIFYSFFVETLNLPVSHISSTSVESGALHYILPIVSIVAIALGAYPSYLMYVKKTLSPEQLTDRYGWLKSIHSFLWNRWYIEAFYNRIFVRTMLNLRSPLLRYVEGVIDKALNVGIPNFFLVLYLKARKIQTGYLPVNMLYVIAFVLALLVIVAGVVVGV